VAALLRESGASNVFIENVHAMPKQGVSSSFRFGDGFGQLKGVIAALQLPSTRVAPAEWKKALKLGRDKEQSRYRASKLYPSGAAAWPRKKDNGIAEAVLIAHYGKHLHG